MAFWVGAAALDLDDGFHIQFSADVPVFLVAFFILVPYLRALHLQWSSRCLEEFKVCLFPPFHVGHGDAFSEVVEVFRDSHGDFHFRLDDGFRDDPSVVAQTVSCPETSLTFMGILPPCWPSSHTTAFQTVKFRQGHHGVVADVHLVDRDTPTVEQVNVQPVWLTVTVVTVVSSCVHVSDLSEASSSLHGVWAVMYGCSNSPPTHESVVLSSLHHNTLDLCLRPEIQFIGGKKFSSRFS